MVKYYVSLQSIETNAFQSYQCIATMEQHVDNILAVITNEHLNFNVNYRLIHYI